MSSVFLEEELLANLEESLDIVTPDTSTKQTGGAATSPLSHSVGSAKSVSSMSNSDRQRVVTSSVGVIPQAVSSAGAETASTSEVCHSEGNDNSYKDRPHLLQ